MWFFPLMIKYKVPVLLQLLWFFPIRTQMLLLECEKQYHPMDPHPANLGLFSHYSSFLWRGARFEPLGKCAPSWNRSQLYYFHKSSGSKPDALIPTVIARPNLLYIVHFGPYRSHGFVLSDATPEPDAPKRVQ